MYTLKVTANRNGHCLISKARLYITVGQVLIRKVQSVFGQARLRQLIVHNINAVMIAHPQGCVSVLHL